MTPIHRDTGTQEHLMSLSTRTYIGLVIAAGAAALVVFAPRAITDPTLALTFLAAMIVVSLFKLRVPLPYGQATLSMAYVVDFAVLVTSGADLAMVIAAAGVLVQCTVNVRRRQPLYRTAFSVAAVVLSVCSAGWVWEAMGGGVTSAAAFVPPLAMAAVPYFLVNSGLVAAAIALSNGVSPLRCWQEHFLRTAPSCFMAAGLVALVGVGISADAYLLLISLALPVAATHIVHTQWFRRVGERLAYSHAAAA